jgi:hypothetical protein
MACAIRVFASGAAAPFQRVLLASIGSLLKLERSGARVWTAAAAIDQRTVEIYSFWNYDTQN